MSREIMTSDSKRSETSLCRVRCRFENWICRVDWDLSWSFGRWLCRLLCWLLSRFLCRFLGGFWGWLRLIIYINRLSVIFTFSVISVSVILFFRELDSGVFIEFLNVFVGIFIFFMSWVEGDGSWIGIL